MFAEYLQIIGGVGDTPLTYGDIRQAVIAILPVIFLMFIGFKIKGIWGVIIALIPGVAFFLYVKGVI